MSKHLREGYAEHITKSFNGAGRMLQGYIVLVNVPGADTFEVGLAEVRRLLGVRQLSPQLTKRLMECKPNMVMFDGEYIESGSVTINSLQITPESANVWVDRLNAMNTATLT